MAPKMNKASKLLKLALTLVASILIIYGALGLIGYVQSIKKGETGNPETVVTHSTKTPREYKPDIGCEAYMSKDESPFMIELTGVGIKGCVQKVGIDQNKSIAVPNNVNVAGWYVNSVKPGEKGVSIIDGHVSGRYSGGIFKNLGMQKQGDLIKIKVSKTEWHEFEVKTVDSYTVSEAANEQYKKLDDVERQLTLITCGGNYNKSNQQYDKRVIVRATFTK